jgi:RNA polymerase-binding transcription factor DksA
MSSPYRLCVACLRPISPERLKTLPNAQYCVVCQGQSEAGHDTRRYVEERPAGNREDQKKMWSRRWEDS